MKRLNNGLNGQFLSLDIQMNKEGKAVILNFWEEVGNVVEKVVSKLFPRPQPVLQPIPVRN